MTLAPHASMRPRQACLGIARHGYFQNVVDGSFNEAEASLPRNPVPIRNHVVGQSKASMRPRQACLGILFQYRRHDRLIARFNEAEASLPRNRWPAASRSTPDNCFNEAEASLPRNHPCRHADFAYLLFASMRPRQACLGIGKADSIYPITPRASMRPRQACLGIYLNGVVSKSATQASMRPRQACLGIVSCQRCTHCGPQRFNEAEASLPRNRAAGFIGL